MDQPIGVGILGANPDRGWAMRGHIPAIESSPDFTFAAVATTRAESAAAARDRFGASYAFTDAASLAGHPDVDLVVVTVKVSAHVELVTAALAAGKHVYCEWPLTRNAGEARALDEAADAAGVHAAVGMQARFSDAAIHARELIAAGHIGRVLSANLFSSRGKGTTIDVPAWTAYTYDVNARAGLVEVAGGHALDFVQHLLGPVRDVSARTAIRSPDHRIAETGEAITVTSADHLLLTAELDGGVLLSVHLLDGESGQPRTRLEIAGTAGNLALVSPFETNPWAAQLQIAPLDLYESSGPGGAWQRVALPTPDRCSLPVEAANVARLYSAVATDIRDGTSVAPGFGTAADLHVLLDAITAGAARQPSPKSL